VRESRRRRRVDLLKMKLFPLHLSLTHSFSPFISINKRGREGNVAEKESL
jgi:hypothetical protein